MASYGYTTNDSTRSSAWGATGPCCGPTGVPLSTERRFLALAGFSEENVAEALGRGIGRIVGKTIYSEVSNEERYSDEYQKWWQPWFQSYEIHYFNTYRMGAKIIYPPLTIIRQELLEYWTERTGEWKTQVSPPARNFILEAENELDQICPEATAAEIKNLIEVRLYQTEKFSWRRIGNWILNILSLIFSGESREESKTFTTTHKL